MTIIRERDAKGHFLPCTINRKTKCIKCGVTEDQSQIDQYTKYAGLCEKCRRRQYYIDNKSKENENCKKYYRSQGGRVKMKERQFGGNYYKRIALDRKMCVICDTRHDLVVHHIDTTGSKSVGTYKKSNNNINNLITMCTSCHTKYHSFIRDGRIESVNKYNRIFNEQQQKLGLLEVHHNS
jgi:Holliday junction resolvase RusA-like endonuclease